MAAAPADFRPTAAAEHKITRGERAISLELEPTDDILAGLASRRRQGQTIIGFAAEAGGDALARAREKLARKGVDAIVLNDVSSSEIGFESDSNEVVVVTAEGDHPVPLASKPEVAEAILDQVDRLRAGAGTRADETH
jgi:phosphopantothenoylcysteine decarboxylase/phosphopantothenate--cysteine ligase